MQPGFYLNYIICLASISVITPVIAANDTCFTEVGAIEGKCILRFCLV